MRPPKEPDPKRRACLAATLNAALLVACGGGGASPALDERPGGAPPAPAPSTPAPPAFGWLGGERVDERPGSLTQTPRVALNADGSAVAVWVRSNLKEVIGHRRAPGALWGDPFKVHEVTHSTPHRMHSACVAIDGAGNALFVWVHEITLNADGGANLHARRFSPSGQSLEFPTLESVQDPLGGFPSQPAVAMNAAGHAVVVWREKNFLFDAWELRAQSSLPGQGWQPAHDTLAAIDGLDASRLSAPQLALGADGSALVAWIQWTAGVAGVMVRAYVAGVWAGAAHSIATYPHVFGPGSTLSTPAVAIGKHGTAVVAWAQSVSGGDQRHIVACRARQFEADDWELPELVQTDAGGQTLDPRVSVDAQGHATVVWEQRRTLSSGLVAQDIESNRFDGTAWANAQRALNTPGTVATAPQIASDGGQDGKVMVVWEQAVGDPQSPRGQVHASHLQSSAPLAWSEPELLESAEDGDSITPALAMNADGAAVAVWRNSTNTQDRFFANAFRPEPAATARS